MRYFQGFEVVLWRRNYHMSTLVFKQQLISAAAPVLWFTVTQESAGALSTVSVLHSVFYRHTLMPFITTLYFFF